MGHSMAASNPSSIYCITSQSAGWLCSGDRCVNLKKSHPPSDSPNLPQSCSLYIGLARQEEQDFPTVNGGLTQYHQAHDVLLRVSLAFLRWLQENRGADIEAKGSLGKSKAIFIPVGYSLVCSSTWMERDRASRSRALLPHPGRTG
jgi:hypothetical protein